MKNIKTFLLLGGMLAATSCFGQTLDALLNKSDQQELSRSDIGKINQFGKSGYHKKLVEKKVDSILKLSAPREDQLILVENVLIPWLPNPRDFKERLRLVKEAVAKKKAAAPTRPLPPSRAPMVPYKRELDKIKEKMSGYKMLSADERAKLDKEIEAKLKNLEKSLDKMETAEHPEAKNFRMELDETKDIINETVARVLLPQPSAPPFEREMPAMMEPEVSLTGGIKLLMNRFDQAKLLKDKYGLLVELDAEFKEANKRAAKATMADKNELKTLEANFKHRLGVAGDRLRSEYAQTRGSNKLKELEDQYTAISKMLITRGEKGLKPIKPGLEEGWEIVEKGVVDPE